MLVTLILVDRSLCSSSVAAQRLVPVVGGRLQFGSVSCALTLTGCLVELRTPARRPTNHLQPRLPQPLSPTKATFCPFTTCTASLRPSLRGQVKRVHTYMGTACENRPEELKAPKLPNIGLSKQNSFRTWKESWSRIRFSGFVG